MYLDKMARGIKTGGRQTGTPNRTTTEIREHFQNLISENLEQLNNDLKELEPIQRLKIIIELSKFVVPTLKATDLSLSDNDEENFKQIVITRIIKNANDQAIQN